MIFGPFIASLPSFHEIDEKNVLHDAVEHFVEHRHFFKNQCCRRNEWFLNLRVCYGDA